MRDGVELILIRHGRTSWNAEGRFLGRSDIALDEVGLAQAATLAQDPDLAQIDAVYASPLSRAADTARALGRPVTLVPALREMEQGDLEGLDFASALGTHGAFLRAWRADPTGVCVPGGESLDQVRDRGLWALQAIAAAHAPGQRVVVVSHQMLLASVCSALAQVPLGSWRTYTLEHVGRHKVHAVEGALRLVTPA